MWKGCFQVILLECLFWAHAEDDTENVLLVFEFSSEEQRGFLFSFLLYFTAPSASLNICSLPSWWLVFVEFKVSVKLKFWFLKPSFPASRYLRGGPTGSPWWAPSTLYPQGPRESGWSRNVTAVFKTENGFRVLRPLSAPLCVLPSCAGFVVMSCPQEPPNPGSVWSGKMQCENVNRWPWKRHSHKGFVLGTAQPLFFRGL